MTELANSKPARRWRVHAARRFLEAVKLECLVSERVAVVYTSSRPYQWGIYGWPNESGQAHQTGREETVPAAKAAARKALDAMADYPAWLAARKAAA